MVVGADIPNMRIFPLCFGITELPLRNFAVHLKNRIIREKHTIFEGD